MTVLVLALFSFQTYAADLSVSITSFVYADSQTRLAELCGQVSGDNSAKSVVTITVDPNSSKPAKYTVLPDNNGAFCSVVVSYSGLASAQAYLK